ncbi:response regulator [Paenibacillus sp. SGZ-1009]|uniref:response regulator n=1 Tax=Paenibacillus campi TaxID=3106031 RepID=UPI002AFE7863|nr:response regulator [Paenibacillus sp. SGZ-1009]
MKVLIVDDEVTVHRQLEQCLDWEQYGWKIVGHAYNGEEACQIAEQEQPNVILTDIRMPHMDGLQFLAWLEQSSITAKVIVLSGYGDYEYSRAAFLLHVKDYLLKPVNEAELLHLLSRVEADLMQESQSRYQYREQQVALYQGLQLMQDEWISHLLSTHTRNENEIIVEAEQLKIRVPEEAYHIVMIKLLDVKSSIVSRFESDKGSFYFAVRNIIRESMAVYDEDTDIFRNLNGYHEFLFFHSTAKDRTILERMLKKMQTALSSYLRVSVKLGISARKKRIIAMENAYQEARHAIKQLRLSDRDTIAFYAEMNTMSAPSQQTLWEEVHEWLGVMLDTGALHNQMPFIDKLDTLLQGSQLEQTSINELQTNITRLLQRLEVEQKDEHTLMLLAQIRSSMQELDIEQMKNRLFELIMYHMHQSSEQNKSRTARQLITLIKRYVSEHYCTVTLEEISRRFFINKNYFCTLFKEENNESFLEFLTRIRIEQAKKLLLNTDLKTYEIAARVGYTDARYFSQVFKKATGTQPSQFKQERINS